MQDREDKPLLSPALVVMGCPHHWQNEGPHGRAAELDGAAARGRASEAK